MSAATFSLTLEYGGLTQQKTHGDVKTVFYAPPYLAPLAMANLGQIPPGTTLQCTFTVVNTETGEITE